MRLDRRSVLTGALAAASVPRIGRTEELEIVGLGGGSLTPALEVWSALYHQERGITIGYRSLGSASAIEQIKADKIPFGGSEKPLQPFDLAHHRLLQFPVVGMGFVPVINISGVHPGELLLDGPTLARIFRGRIDRWDDPDIVRHNGALTLPPQPIVPVNRTQGSGTSFNVSNYFSKIDLIWMLRIGDGLVVDWPTGVLAGGTAGVASKVAEQPGAIGFVEYTYAREHQLTTADMLNRRGRRVRAGAESFAAAIADADFAASEDFYLILTNQGGEESWPLTAAGYILMREEAEPSINHKLLEYFAWCLRNGAEAARARDYVPMPDHVVELIHATWWRRLRWRAP